MGQTQTSNPYAWIGDDLAAIHRAGWYRSPRAVCATRGPEVIMDGRTVLQFASNDYLGLSRDPRLAEAATAAIAEFGTGATGSRLTSGDRDLHHRLEGALARWKGTEDCLLFGSGYLANLGVIPTLVGQRDLVLSDQYNHASLRSGVELSGATHRYYAHGDMEALESLLDRERAEYRRCLLVSDSVFSMDGDLAPLGRLVALAEHYSGMVLIDEAHCTGVLGGSGAGALEHWGITVPVIQMGTLSKALGSVGGYVCGGAELIDYLRNRSRTWIYTTGNTPADAAAALRAVEIVPTEPERRARLWQRIEQLRRGLAALEVTVLPHDAGIFCLAVGDIETTARLSQGLFERGIFAPAIRPPTVPTSRIRLSLMATHTPEMIDQLLAGIAESLSALMD